LCFNSDNRKSEVWYPELPHDVNGEMLTTT
jgi:hypothetical protein